MLQKLKELFNGKELLKGNIGIEREGLRVYKNGVLSKENHPSVFGNKLKNPYITTDFAESQLELITPTFKSSEEAYNFLINLYDISTLEMKDEYLWPESMPCIIPKEKDSIKIASFDDSIEGIEARLYRENLVKKYGSKKQLISGIHYNFSFDEDIIKKLFKNTNTKEDYKTFKDNLYLKVTRNYLRYSWLIIYLLGSSSLVHESYIEKDTNFLEKISKNTFSKTGLVSYRNGEGGYKNNRELYPDYYSVKGYVDSIKNWVDNKYIQNHKELYSTVRLKAKNKKDLLNSLLTEGIYYLEYRNIDINPFDKSGISLKDLNFLQLFNLFLLIKEESDYKAWQEEALFNERAISEYGNNDITLKLYGEEISKEKWALEILREIEIINKELKLGKEDIIDFEISKVKDFKLTYSYKILERVKEEGYVNAHINLAKKYKEEAFKNRFKFLGYEDMELSTEILMKESIKRGIRVEVIDKSENFISLKKDNKTEYVKQATKTSKDNYVSVLMMENKVVTKKVLKDAKIRVPKGMEFHSIEEAKYKIGEFIKKPIVVKPKSTNFGLGISIFPKGVEEEEDIIKALNIAFSYDNTVLVEEFIVGKEYRFLVIGDKVAGVLHRVPANVLGNGINTIEELVMEKNKGSLRGKGYKTPLEKINLDENAKLFLKQSNKDINYIPEKEELIYLRENSNISTGGDSVDYTDNMPERFKLIAVNCAKAIGANICGVDMMIKDFKDENSEYGIIELNFNPAIHIHCFPYIGKERNIAKEVLKLLELI